MPKNNHPDTKHVWTIEFSPRDESDAVAWATSRGMSADWADIAVDVGRFSTGDIKQMFGFDVVDLAALRAARDDAHKSGLLSARIRQRGSVGNVAEGFLTINRIVE